MEDEVEFLILNLIFEDKYAETWGNNYFEFIRLDTLRAWSWQSVPGEKFLGNLPPQNFIDIAVIPMRPSFIERIKKGELKFHMGLAACAIEDPGSKKILWQKNMGEKQGTWTLPEEPLDE